MATADLLTAPNLPASSRVDQRVPKKLPLENGAPTAADKRLISDGIEEVLWLAALKPTTIGVPEYRDDVREVLEIAVLRLTVRAAAKAARLVELVHRAVPYPLLLLISISGDLPERLLCVAGHRLRSGSASRRSGSPAKSRRSKRICSPTRLRVPAPVRLLFATPCSSARARRSRYCPLIRIRRRSGVAS